MPSCNVFCTDLLHIGLSWDPNQEKSKKQKTIVENAKKCQGDGWYHARFHIIANFAPLQRITEAFVSIFSPVQNTLRQGL